jgi:sigma-B regulation protein RsbU (phosphoserine phosphatase)
MAHAIVQHRLHSGAAIAATCTDLNQGLCHAQSGRFMTCAMVCLEQQSLEFTYVSAGHCPLLWLHQGEVRWLESGGLPLGIILDNTLALAGPFRALPGDYLLLFTDGVTETSNQEGESFGDQRLADTVVQGAHLHLGPGELMMLINAEVDAWSGGRAQLDDLTMVVVQFVA